MKGEATDADHMAKSLFIQNKKTAVTVSQIFVQMRMMRRVVTVDGLPSCLLRTWFDNHT